MNQFGIESLIDLEALTPQLSIGRATSGSGTSISIRDIFSPFTSIGIEQSVAVIIDGVYYPQGRSINEALMDTSSVSILKGPQALYFGKNATAGVISPSTATTPATSSRPASGSTTSSRPTTAPWRA